MNPAFFGLAFALISLIGAFLPIAAAGGLYANIGHLGGVAWLLYVIPALAAALWLVRIYRPQIPYLSVWLLALAIGGSAVGGLTVVSGMNHVNAFVAMQMNFEEERARFRQQFGQVFTGSAMVQEQADTSPGKERPAVTARPGLGGVLILIGYLGMLGALVVRRKQTVAAAAALLLVFAALPSFAAEKPMPFGLQIGVSTSRDALAVIEAEGGRITRSGNRIISGDIVNPAVEGMIVEGLKIEGLREARFWFLNGTLMGIDYDFPASMSKSEFYRLLDLLREKYGKPIQLQRPQLAEGIAVWRSGDVETRLSVPWVASSTSLEYRSISLVKKAAVEDRKVYERENRATARRQKGI